MSFYSFIVLEGEEGVTGVTSGSCSVDDALLLMRALLTWELVRDWFVFLRSLPPSSVML